MNLDKPISSENGSHFGAMFHQKSMNKYAKINAEKVMEIDERRCEKGPEIDRESI